MAESLLDTIQSIYTTSGKREMHVDDIAELLLQRYPKKYSDFEDTKNKVTSCLSNNVKSKKNGKFRRVPSKKHGSYKRGYYALKTKRTPPIDVKEHKSITPKAQTGRGGEFAVISELLFIGHNATLLPVDTGIDVISTKDDKYFHIQVKTNTWDGNANFVSYSIKTSSYEANNKACDYYVFVIRKAQGNKWVNDYIVLHSSSLKDRYLKQQGKQSFTVKFEFVNKHIFMAGTDVTHALDDFQSIQ